MAELKDLLLVQREDQAAKVEDLAEQMEARRLSFIEALKIYTAASEELKRIDLLLETLTKEEAKSAQPTIMQSVIEVLRQHHPNGMTALEILDEINRRHFGGTLVRTSLSPQLSRLKDRDHKIILRGTRWFLAPQQPSLLTQKQ
jgi:hypothetical protein